eukprot:CAMPEP_0115016550 /NCGR_PEP_ID=MMETSP0216-20121206/27513_1 /TAXON_ID=223996 /ORGANISM="Protocruzia adherens, Strain Boccale" /LENGTH=922 /DNA_ID=CAMNT_0002387047 /DNA_START=323 /DNA_END=3091 /DNA_ORIENTATION=+
MLCREPSGITRLDTPHYVGESAKNLFFKAFKRQLIEKQLREYRQEDFGATHRFLDGCERRRLVPQPIGLVRPKGSEVEVNVEGYSMGDQYAATLSESLTYMSNAEKINLRRNRLTDKGAARLLQSLPMTNVKHLDISYNMLAAESCALLGDLIQKRHKSLLSVNLENCKLDDRAFGTIYQPIANSSSLQDLNLSRNHLQNKSGEYLGFLLATTNSLVKLTVHWNKIRSQGAIEIFDGMMSNESLRMFDISFNAIASMKAAEKIAAVLSYNTRLLHADLSHNQLNSDHCNLISTRITDNHTLLGLHMDGNDCVLDPHGFMIPSSFENTSTTDSIRRLGMVHISPRILGERRELSPTADDLRRKNDLVRETPCWICEGWNEVEFVWSPGTSDYNKNPVSVFLHLDIDDFEADMMNKGKDDIFRKRRMLPPGKARYFFSINCDYGTTARDQLDQGLPQAYTKAATFGEEVIKTVKVEKLNYMEVERLKELENKEAVLSRARAKPRQGLQKLPQKERPPTPWSVERSIFKGYKPDSQSLLNRCFEVDWNCSRIPRLIKDAEQCEAVKEIFRENYRVIREVYKVLAACNVQGLTFAVTLNTFTEFCNSTGIIDGRAMQLADVDFNFISTNSAANGITDSRNPKRALIRYQMMEILARLAMDKYIMKGNCQSFPTAVRKLLKDSVLKKYGDLDSHNFRVEKLWNEECDIVFRCWEPVLRSLYNTYCGKHSLPGEKKWMSIEEFSELIQATGLSDEEIALRDVDISFNLAMMTQIDELTSDRFKQMQWLEFLDALGRVAESMKVEFPCNPNPHLSIKLEYLLQMLFKKGIKDKQNFEVPPSIDNKHKALEFMRVLEGSNRAETNKRLTMKESLFQRGLLGLVNKSTLAKIGGRLDKQAARSKAGKGSENRVLNSSTSLPALLRGQKAAL